MIKKIVYEYRDNGDRWAIVSIQGDLEQTVHDAPYYEGAREDASRLLMVLNEISARLWSVESSINYLIGRVAENDKAIYRLFNPNP